MLSTRNGALKRVLLILALACPNAALSETKSAHGGTEAKCARNVLVTTLKMYACKYLVNTHAQSNDDPELSIKEFPVSDGWHMNARMLGNEAEPSLCGYISFRIASEPVDAVQPDHVNNALNLARVFFDNFNIGSRIAESEAKSIGKSFFKGAQVGSFPAAPSLEAEIARLDKFVRDGIASIEAVPPAKIDWDHCAVNTGAVAISLPVVVGPDLTALAKHREVASDYANFAALLEKSPLMTGATKSP